MEYVNVSASFKAPYVSVFLFAIHKECPQLNLAIPYFQENLKGYRTQARSTLVAQALHPQQNHRQSAPRQSYRHGEISIAQKLAQMYFPVTPSELA